MNPNKKHRYQRGYPMAVLVGFEEKKAVIWRIFSKVIKPYTVVELKGEDKTHLFNFHESIVNTLRPMFKEGIRSIITVAPLNTDYAKKLRKHIQTHHLWLTKNNDSIITFGELAGSASQLHEVSKLVKTQEFRKILPKVLSEDADNIADILEQQLNEINSGKVVLYSLEEIEKMVYNHNEQLSNKSRYLILTNRYLAETREKKRIYRLLQISENKNVNMRIVDIETKAGSRVSQLGGLVYFTYKR